jgi:homoserine O-acetyltransferase/O-succinyltransferase
LSQAATLERDVSIGTLALDSGVVLDDVLQRVTVYGEPRPDGANVVLVNHALTGSGRVSDWWDDIVGPGRLFDTDVVAVVGVNALGSCYGSTGPLSLAPDGDPYGARFPLVTVWDMVRAQRTALAALGLRRFAVVTGGSLGGMQSLAWALEVPAQVDHVVAIGAYDHFTAMGIALNYVAREAIRLARTEAEGIELARKIAMLTYKSEALLAERFERRFDRKGGDPSVNPEDKFDVEGYLDYQGAIFSKRMNPYAYLALTRAMDLFDARTRPLSDAHPAFTFVGISSDWLFLPEYVRATAQRFADEGADSVYLELASNHGHDAFLAEPDHLIALVAPRLAAWYASLERQVAIS